MKAKGVTFESAIYACKCGATIRRQDWAEGECVIFVTTRRGWSKGPARRGGEPGVFLKFGFGARAALWEPSAESMTATDWEILS